jgi:hypothetical protein
MDFEEILVSDFDDRPCPAWPKISVGREGPRRNLKGRDPLTSA